MELSLEQCIQYLLYRDQRLTLPGIGVLKVKRTPAHFSDNREELLPPTYSVVFEEITDHAETTIPTHMETAYNREADQIRNNIFNQGQAPLFGLGRLVREDELVVFHQNQAKIDQIWGGLKSIQPISEVSRTYVPPTHYVPAVETQTFEQKKTRNLGWLKWLGVTLLAGILIYFLMFHPWESGSNEGTDVAEMQLDTVKTGPEPLSKTENNEQETDAISSTDTLSKISPKSESQLFEYVIITGSFKKARYVERMATRLNQLGFEVYRGDNDSTTRVGARVKCRPDQLDTLLNKIRSEVEPRAWVLK